MIQLFTINLQTIQKVYTINLQNCSLDGRFKKQKFEQCESSFKYHRSYSLINKPSIGKPCHISPISSRSCKTWLVYCSWETTPGKGYNIDVDALFHSKTTLSDNLCGVILLVHMSNICSPSFHLTVYTSCIYSLCFCIVVYMLICLLDYISCICLLCFCFVIYMS
jgi:hypothetical protein